VAQVLAPHGVRGELKCRLITDFPERFRPGMQVVVGPGLQPDTIRSARVQPPIVYLRLANVPDRTAAERLRGAEILVRREEAVRLAKGQFYWHEVLGLRVEDATSGRELGRVTDILETGANDVYVVHGQHGEILVPAIKAVVKLIDPPAGRMLIAPLPGMLPTDV
jgi:16S rRNA processing protein RimM